MKNLVLGNYTVSTPLYDILTDLKKELTNGKLATIQKKGSYISVTCPFHNDGMEKHPSCGIYIGDTEAEYGAFNCFTCGTKGSFVYFLSACMDSSKDYAEKWLISRYGELTNNTILNLEPIELTSNTKTEYLDEDSLDSFQSYHPYMDKRKLSPKVCEKFKIKYDPKSECLVFPVWDDKDRLVMLTRRSVKNKQFYIDKDKEKPVYLMNFIKKLQIHEVTIVESQINCLTLWGWNIPSVATFGCNVTPKQIDILNKSDVRHVYLCFDGDAAGHKGNKKLISSLRSDIMVDVIEMPAGKDVNDLNEEEFNKLQVKEGQEWLKENL